MNAALSAAGATGYSLQLCPGTNYPINAPIKFSFPNQEIATQGFPGLDLSQRATLTVNGPVDQGNTGGHTTAVDGSCSTCDSVALRYVQINGNRGAAPVVGGGNVEFVSQRMLAHRGCKPDVFYRAEITRIKLLNTFIHTIPGMSLMFIEAERHANRLL